MDSQASKHLSWCLNKAKKEIEECKNQGKKERHRGILKIEPSRGMALKHLEKAKHNLEVFKFLRKNKFSDWSVMVENLQEEEKIKINPDIIDFMKYEEGENSHENSIIELREDYTYGVDLEVKDEQHLDKIEKLCIEFIDSVKDILYDEIEKEFKK